ncbi:MAG TPA: YHS domain-containing protein [Blastocatellia bacterium]|nr:YHS domain-containing protein [Blastocatellia bacterium]
MLKIAFVVLLLLVTFAGAVAVAATSNDGVPKKNVTNKVCPVSGGAVVEKYRTEYKGQFVYFCCEGCLNEFSKGPDAFVAKLSKEDQEAIKPNEVCPVSGEPVNRSLSLEFEGRKVYFCCEHCVETYKKDHPTAK